MPALSPTQLPASNCPCGTDSSAPRMVSALYAPALMPMTTTAVGKALTITPTLGSPKNTTYNCTSSGVPRMTQM